MNRQTCVVTYCKQARYQGVIPFCETHWFLLDIETRDSLYELAYRYGDDTKNVRDATAVALGELYRIIADMPCTCTEGSSAACDTCLALSYVQAQDDAKVGA